MSLEPATRPEDGGASRLLDRAADIARIYSRAFLAQGAGLVGLAWCLDQNLPAVAFGLTVLVLIDQAVFLRGRPALQGAPRLQTGLDIWCLGVSGADLLLLCATSFRAAGLRDAGGVLVADPLSCLAFAVATAARLDLGLMPVDGVGRLVAAGEALLADLVLVLAVAGALRLALAVRPSVTRR